MKNVDYEFLGYGVLMFMFVCVGFYVLLAVEEQRTIRYEVCIKEGRPAIECHLASRM